MANPFEASDGRLQTGRMLVQILKFRLWSSEPSFPNSAFLQFVQLNIAEDRREPVAGEQLRPNSLQTFSENNNLHDARVHPVGCSREVALQTILIDHFLAAQFSMDSGRSFKADSSGSLRSSLRSSSEDPFAESLYWWGTSSSCILWNSSQNHRKTSFSD